MATKLSIALRTEEATRRLQGAIDKLAQSTGAVLPVGAQTTKSANENQAILLETLAAQIEALADTAQPKKAEKPKMSKEQEQRKWEKEEEQELTETGWPVIKPEPVDEPAPFAFPEPPSVEPREPQPEPVKPKARK